MFATARSLDLTAADLMSRDITIVPRGMSLRHAAHLLSEAQISGAPVVDEAGECCGVLSAIDFMHSAGLDDDDVRSHPNPGCFHSAWQVEEETTHIKDVGDIMTADPVTASPETTIVELARMMRDAHIHRIIVVNERQRPIGVVSSTDILAAIANAERFA